MKNRHSVSLFVIILCFFASSGEALAIPLFSAEGLGRGGSGVAGNNVHDVYATNPSTMLFAKYYAVGGSFASQGNTLIASIVDTKTSSIAGAMSYVYQVSSLAAPVVGAPEVRSAVLLALAGSPLEGFAVGIMGQYLWKDYADLVKDQQPRFPVDLDIGMKYQLSEVLAVGGVVRHLLVEKHTSTNGPFLLLPDVAVGISIQPIADILITADGGTWFKYADANKNKWHAAIGIEAKVSENFRLRGGYNVLLDTPNPHTVSAGVTLSVDSFQIAYGSAVRLETEPLVHEHRVTITLML